MNKRNALTLAAILFLSLNLEAQTGASSLAARETEVLEVAGDRVDAWNGKIDKDRMMGQYHPDMQYIWRGKPMDYIGFESMLVTYIIPYTNYTLTMTNTIVRIINEGGAVVSSISRTGIQGKRARQP